MNILILIILILFPTLSHAEYLGCFEPSETVYATVQFNGVTGEVAATSVSARVLDPDDTTTPTATPTMTAVDGTNAVGLFRGSFSVGASPTAGTWTIRYKGTVDGNVQAGSDTFHVVDTTGDCASRTGVVTASGTVTSITNGVTLANDAITAAKIAAGAIGLSELCDLSATVTSDVTPTVTTISVDRTEANDWFNKSLTAYIVGLSGTAAKTLGEITDWVNNTTYSTVTIGGNGLAITPVVGDVFCIIEK